MQHETALKLVELVYAAAYDQEQWPVFLRALTDALGGTGASLASVSEEDRNVALQSGVGILGADFQKDYATVASHDPWLARSRAGGRLWKTGAISVGEELVSMRELTTTEFYSEFARRHDYVGGLTGIIVSDPSGMAAVSVCRRISVAFGEQEVALMALLMPHLRRALQVHTHLAEANARTDGLHKALDRVQTGTMVLDKRGAVVFANESARAMLAQRDGLSLDQGVLRAARPSDNTSLRRLIAKTDDAGAEESAAGGVLLVTRPSARRPLHVVVAPVGGDRARDHGASVIVFVTDPERTVESDPAALRRLYLLSRTEAEVAGLLMRDKSVQEIAALLGIRANTVRFHLKRLFSKTGTRRQSELVGLLVKTSQVSSTK